MKFVFEILLTPSSFLLTSLQLKQFKHRTGKVLGRIFGHLIGQVRIQFAAKRLFGLAAMHERRLADGLLHFAEHLPVKCPADELVERLARFVRPLFWVGFVA